jgi:uncharacterized OB-fold protein
MNSKPAQEMSAHAAAGRFALQHCSECGAVQYPARELCSACLSGRLEWHVADAVGGEVLATTILHHSHEEAFRDALPLCIGLIRLDPGPAAVAFLSAGCRPGTRVVVTARTDAAGRAILTATPAQ